MCCVRIAKSSLLCDLFWWNNLPQNHRLNLDYKHIIRYSSNICFCLGLTTNYLLKHNKHPLKPSLLSWRVFLFVFFFRFLIRKRDTSAEELNRGQMINWRGRGEGRRRTLCAAVSLTLRTTDEKNTKTTGYVGWYCWGVRSKILLPGWPELLCLSNEYSLQVFGR